MRNKLNYLLICLGVVALINLSGCAHGRIYLSGYDRGVGYYNPYGYNIYDDDLYDFGWYPYRHHHDFDDHDHFEHHEHFDHDEHGEHEHHGQHHH